MANKEKEIDMEILEDSDEIITLFDDDDNPVDFYQIAGVEYDNDFYTILQPASELEGIEDDEALIFRIVEEGDDSVFLPVESEELLDKIFDEYLRMVADEASNQQNDEKPAKKAPKK